jgi:D-alanine-D-alanine ligase
VPKSLPDFVSHLSALQPHVCFNALHGRYGEDGCMQSVLDWMHIPYTHSGRLASTIAMDKPLAKDIFARAGLSVARHALVSRDALLAADPLPRPYVLKPMDDGSSVDVCILQAGDPFPDTITMKERWPYGDVVMAEEYIAGRELTVGVHNGAAITVTEITTDHHFYDYTAKYQAGESRHTLPAQIPADLHSAACAAAVRAHEALGCRGISRSDFRYDGQRLVILETNTQPGLTPTSLVPEQAQFIGISFQDLCCAMLAEAAYEA